MKTGRNTSRVLLMFLVGSTPEILSKNRARQDAQTDEILRRYRISDRSKRLIRKDEDILTVNSHDADGFVVFPYTLQRFASLIHSEKRSDSWIFSDP